MSGDESKSAYFLTRAIMQGSNWRALEKAISRLLSHCGWQNIQLIGESGDKGADVLATRRNPMKSGADSYLFQIKAVSSEHYVGESAIDQGIKAQGYYKSKIVVIATNGEFTCSAHQRKAELVKQGYDVRLWNGAFLLELINEWPEYSSDRREPRRYQEGIIEAVIRNFQSGCRKTLFIVATGLGKTLIASSIADRLYAQGLRKVLVLCHATDLAFQLQKSFWAQISKRISTRVFTGGEPPVPMDGINFGLYQTLFGYLGGVESTAFDVIIIDEAHHALANAFASCIEHLSPKLLMGMTATPWRGDGASIESIFGEPIASISLIDGMRMGYLAKVDYRLMCDNINWREIPKIAKTSISIRDLNKRLFLPQRDDAVISKLVTVIEKISNPRIAVFSPSKNHADVFALKLTSSGIPCANLSINNKFKRREILLSFSVGKLKAITAVDILNEGIDIPDVNILVFLRATHSRRIFVQQLGRGLRIASGKDQVIVLDFVTDIRRIAAVNEIEKEARIKPKGDEIETIFLREGVVTFSNEKVQSFIDAWLTDVANLQDCDDMEKLSFPDAGIFYE